MSIRDVKLYIVFHQMLTRCSVHCPHKATNHNGWLGAAAFKGSDAITSFLTVENLRLLDESWYSPVECQIFFWFDSDIFHLKVGSCWVDSSNFVQFKNLVVGKLHTPIESTGFWSCWIYAEGYHDLQWSKRLNYLLDPGSEYLRIRCSQSW